MASSLLERGNGFCEKICMISMATAAYLVALRSWFNGAGACLETRSIRQSPSSIATRTTPIWPTKCPLKNVHHGRRTRKVGVCVLRRHFKMRFPTLRVSLNLHKDEWNITLFQTILCLTVMINGVQCCFVSKRLRSLVKGKTCSFQTTWIFIFSELSQISLTSANSDCKWLCSCGS